MKIYGIVLFGLLLLLPACRGRDDIEPASLLGDRDREFVEATLGGLDRDLRVVLFSEKNCEYCDLAEGLLEEIAALAPRLAVEVITLKKNAARVRELGFERVPGMALLGAADYNVRYYGLPTGYELTTIVEAMRLVADGDPGLMPETIEALSLLEKPVKITVFATKT